MHPLNSYKFLTISEKIKKNAEEEGIDWYEIWTNLEEFEVKRNSQNKNGNETLEGEKNKISYGPKWEE